MLSRKEGNEDQISSVKSIKRQRLLDGLRTITFDASYHHLSAQWKWSPIFSLKLPASLILLFRSQLLILSPFNSFSVFIRRCCTHIRYLPSFLTLSQFNNSVNVHLICSLTSCSLTSSSCIDDKISFSSMIAGREDLRLIIRGLTRVEDVPVEEMLDRWWWWRPILWEVVSRNVGER